MGRSRRKYKQSRTKVRVGLPKKNPRIFKPAFSISPKLLQSVADHPKWDDKASVIQNYNSFGVVSNPNLLSVRSRTPQILQTDSLQLPPPPSADSNPIDSGSELEEDELRSALGKKRRDGKSAFLQPLTAMQRIHIGRLVNKYGDDYQSMLMDIKLNAMQHSVGTLRKLCTRPKLAHKPAARMKRKMAKQSLVAKCLLTCLKHEKGPPPTTKEAQL